MATATILILGWLLLLVGSDLRDRLLPNRLTVPAVIAVLAMSTTDPRVGPSVAALAAPYVVACLAGGCGGGDVKLAAALGGLVGDPWRALVIVLVAAVLGLFAAAVQSRARPGDPDRRPHAHGPPLVCAALSCGGLV